METASPRFTRRSSIRALLRHVPLWWSHVLFPGSPALSANTRKVRLGEILLALAVGLLYFSSLDCPLQEPEETLYAEIPRQMLAEDRLLIPVRHGQPYYDKPPLLYWLVMASYTVFGIHDWAARLVSATALWLCVLATYAWGKRALGPRAAFAGAAMLAMAPRFAQLGRMLTMNGLLALWIVIALAAAHRARIGPRLARRWWLLSAVACGLGVLTKGPVALVLVAGPVLLASWLDRRGALPSLRAWFAFGATTAAVALPWFVLVALRDPAFVRYFIWTHHVRRFADPIDHAQPFWYYVPLLLLGALPWTLFVPGLLRSLMGRPCTDRPRALGFFLLAGVWGLLFLSASGCKRPSYLLPVMPPLALALGCFVDTACAAGRLRWSHWCVTAATTFVLLLGAAQILLPRYAGRFSLREQLTPQAAACTEAMPVLCYPHGWDAVPFYLQRDDVRVFGPNQLAELAAALERHRHGLVVVKSGAALEQLQGALPSALEFVPCSRRSVATVGWVRPR